MTASTHAYAELATMSCFSFLRGASFPGELVREAYALGCAGLAIADRNTLAGVVRAHSELKKLKAELAERSPPQKTDFKLIIGARLAFSCGAPDVLAYCRDREGYARLCRLLTLGGTRVGGKKGDCTISLDDLLADTEGLLLALAPPDRPDEGLGAPLERMVRAAPGRVWLAARMDYGPIDGVRLETLAGLARSAGAPLLAVNDVLYHHPERRPLQDVMGCIREHTTLQAAGGKLLANHERHLKPPEEMARLFRGHAEAVAETVRLASLCDFSLEELKYEYPDEPVPPGKTPQQHLEDLTWAGAARRYPQGIPDKVRRTIVEEFSFIAEVDYARYFLTVHDIVAWARSQEPPILCQGRGSAANSVVCYCLGVTAVDPMEINLLFARFLSANRNEPPDIDVDFEHERREEVIQYVYGRYGRHRAAICATVIHYRPRSAIREVGKVFGLSEDVTGALAGTVWGSWGTEMAREQVRQAGLDPDNPTINQVVDLANQLIGFPRHLSQHVGGFVLTQRRLDETVPIVNAAMPDRTFIEWDKDDIDDLGIMKVDVLALGMLTCIRKAFDLMKGHPGLPVIEDMADLPREDPATYDMICEADTVGVFQIESRAQMNMLPRLRPRNFYDLVVEVAIVRPGPIQGDMVHPYLRRRQGKEEIEFASPHPDFGPADELESVLEKTLGVPLFQEHAMQIAITAARFTPSEADGLRRAMATFKHSGRIDVYRDKMVGGMVARGYPPDFAERCFKQIEGFGSYGFPESHAASFAKLVYVSAWLKRHQPAVFACALLNAQPMGFYAPAQIVRDAREHAVEVRPIDVEHSDWDCTLERGEDGPALRLGFRQVGGFSEDWAERLVAGRAAGFGDFDGLLRRSGLTQAQLQKLAQADAMQSLGLDRRQALWKVRGMARAQPSPLLAELPDDEAPMALPAMALSEQVVVDYRTTRLSLKAHPMGFLRPGFEAVRAWPCRRVQDEGRDGRPASVAGVVLVRQRPGQGKVVFVTLEDETGVANLVILPEVFKRYRKVVMSARLMLAEGRIQRSPEGVTHLLAYKLVDRSEDLRALSEPDLFDSAPAARPVAPHGHSHPRNVRIIPASRDFH